MVEKRFLIPVQRRWKLLILPILALLYFVAIVLLAALGYEVEGVPMEYLVLAGAALFALVFLIELPFMFRRKVRPTEEPAAEGDMFLPPGGDEGETVPDGADVFAPPAVEPDYSPAAATPPAGATVAGAVDVIRDDELMMTNEHIKGLDVLEYNWPAKSTHPGAVYAKAMIPVTKAHVLRVETLAAERHEI